MQYPCNFCRRALGIFLFRINVQCRSRLRFSKFRISASGRKFSRNSARHGRPRRSRRRHETAVEIFRSAAAPSVLRSSAPHGWRRRVRGRLRLLCGFEHGGRELQTCGVQQVAFEKGCAYLSHRTKLSGPALPGRRLKSLFAGAASRPYSRTSRERQIQRWK